MLVTERANSRNFVDFLIELPHKPSGSVAAYGLALCCVGVAFLLRLLLGVLDHDASPFTILYPAICLLRCGEALGQVRLPWSWEGRSRGGHLWTRALRSSLL